jgi:hypothetical protein
MIEIPIGELILGLNEETNEISMETQLIKEIADFIEDKGLNDDWLNCTKELSRIIIKSSIKPLMQLGFFESE